MPIPLLALLAINNRVKLFQNFEKVTPIKYYT